MNIMKGISKVAVVILCVLTTFLAGAFDGFERGTLLESGIHSSHGTGYRLIADCYLLLGVASYMLGIRVFFHQTKWTIVAALGGLVLSAYAFYFIVFQKMLTLQISSPYTKLMRDALVYDVVTGGLILVIFGVEFGFFMKEKGSKNLF